jgi:uncharacterized surface protein with fasciclin (FAS1) repeats
MLITSPGLRQSHCPLKRQTKAASSSLESVLAPRPVLEVLLMQYESEGTGMNKRNFIAVAVALMFGFSALQASAQKDPMVGGAAMYPTKNIVENAVNSKDHTTLVAAVKAAGLVDTLQGPGPFTVFAPTNEAFDKLPAGTVDTLLKPENLDQLKKILTYHVVAGKMTSKDIAKAIKAGKGKAVLTTVEGGKLTAMMSGGKLVLTDEKGGTSTVTIANVIQSNGVIHVVDTVLMPN